MARSTPAANALGSKAGRLVNDRTSPLRGSSTTAAPSKPVAANPSSVAFCTSASMVSCIGRPITGALLSLVSSRISRPTLLTITALAPSTPISCLL